MTTNKAAPVAPWSGIGEPIDPTLNAEGMRKAAKQSYTVTKRQVSFADGKDAIAIKDTFALVRDSDKKLLSIVGKVYKPVQTDKAFTFFHDFAKQAHLKVEFAGPLDAGKFVWALARVGHDTIGKKDEVRNYLYMCSPFVHGRAMIMQHCILRAANMTTIMLPIWPKGVRTPTPATFELDKVREAKRVVAALKDQAASFKKDAIALGGAKVTKERAEQFFLDVLRKRDSNRTPAAFPKYKSALEFAPGTSMTWWGALQAVLYVIDHEQGKSRDTALKNAWLGNQSKVKRHALKLAIEGAKK
jgi:phage/plasmid-like protein (TIGR03299 family)